MVEQLGSLNPDDPKALERWRQVFSQVANSDVAIGWTDATDRVGKRHDGQWFADIHRGGSVLEAIHEVGHIMFSPFDFSEAVSLKLGDSRIKLISNAIEDVRIERLVDVWYGTNVYDWHQNELACESTPAELAQGINANLGFAIANEIYHLGGKLTNQVWQDTINHFQSEIHAATMSPDPMASVNLAIEIAAYLKWAEQQPPPPGDGGDSGGDGDPEDNEGEGEGSDDGDSGDGEGDTEAEGEGEGGQAGSGTDSPTGSGPGKQPGQPTPGQDKPNDATGQVSIPIPGPVGGGDNPELPDAPPPPLPEEVQKQIHQAILEGTKEIAKQLKKEVAKPQREKVVHLDPSQHKRMEKRLGDGHGYKEYPQLGYYPIVIAEQTKVLLDKQDGLRAGRVYYSGRPRANAWQINYGNTRVFSRPLKTRGKIVVLLDYSGSMHCPCGCESKDKIAMGIPPEHAHSNGYIASQIVAALASSQPGLEVMGFGGNDLQATIIRHPGEVRPPCWHGHDSVRGNAMGGGTPLCSALMAFRDELTTSGSLQNATALVITDGGPNHCFAKGLGPNPPVSEHHVSKLTHEMANSGVNFGVISVGYTGQPGLFPPAVTANVNGINELDKIQPLLDMIQG